MRGKYGVGRPRKKARGNGVKARDVRTCVHFNFSVRRPLAHGLERPKKTKTPEIFKADEIYMECQMCVELKMHALLLYYRNLWIKEWNAFL